MKRYYLGVVFKDGSLYESESCLSFRHACRKRQQILTDSSHLTNVVMYTAIAPAYDDAEAKRRLRKEAGKILEESEVK